MRAVLLNSPELAAYDQMALDEALLNSSAPETLSLRFYRWPGGIQESGLNQVPAAVTFGYFQNYLDVEKEVRARGFSLTFPLVRRLTGGGIVYHDGDITFSVVFPWNRLETASWVYKNLHRGIHLGLRALGLRSQLWSPPLSRLEKGKNNATAVCFVEPSPMDIVAEDGRKILGGALRRRAGTGLYQGSMRPEAFQISRDRLVQAVVEGVSLEWKVLFQTENVTRELLDSTERLRQNRYATGEWNKKR